MERIDTIVVGAGQAGLATSYYLQQMGHEHVVLERGSTVAPVWRNERWDSFTTVTPNWSLKLPGMLYAGPDPDGFLTRGLEVVTGAFGHAAEPAGPSRRDGGERAATAVQPGAEDVRRRGAVGEYSDRTGGLRAG